MMNSFAPKRATNRTTPSYIWAMQLPTVIHSPKTLIAQTTIIQETGYDVGPSTGVG